MSFDPPLICPWRCYEIGGPWISENPECPFHGYDPIDLDSLDDSDGLQLCAEKEKLNFQEDNFGNDDI